MRTRLKLLILLSSLFIIYRFFFGNKLELFFNDVCLSKEMRCVTCEIWAEFQVSFIRTPVSNVVINIPSQNGCRHAVTRYSLILIPKLNPVFSSYFLCILETVRFSLLNCLRLHGARLISCQSVVTETQVRFQGRACGISGRQSGTNIGLFPSSVGVSLSLSLHDCSILILNKYKRCITLRTDRVCN